MTVRLPHRETRHTHVWQPSNFRSHLQPRVRNLAGINGTCIYTYMHIICMLKSQERKHVDSVTDTRLKSHSPSTFPYTKHASCHQSADQSHVIEVG